MHEILHLLGIDTQQSYFYDFWSGVATQGSLVIAGLSIYKHKNCHVHLCWRVGRFQIGDYLVCKRHHPVHQNQRVEPDHIQFAHEKSKQA